MSRMNYIAVAVIATATIAVADVSVTFVNSLPAGTQPGIITLDFTVDGSGNVNLDASSTSADIAVINAIDEWDGTAGSVSYAPAFGTTFSINMSGSGNLRLTAQGNLGGIGVEGQNQNKLDRPGIEEVYATAVYDGYVAALDVKSMEWTGAGGGDAQGQKARLDTSSETFNYPIDMTADGSWDVSGSNVYVNSGESLAIGNDHSVTNLGSGYVVAGFTFDLKVFEGDSTLTTTFTENPGTGSTITNVFTVSADGTETASSANSGLPTEGLLAGATGSFDWTWEPVDLFDSTAITGRVGTGWAYNGGDDAYGPVTILYPTINIQNSEAVIMTISTNSLALPAGKYLRLDNLRIRNSSGNGLVSHYDVSEDSVTVLTGDELGQNPIVVNNTTSGEIQPLNVIVEDGDKIALWADGGGQIRLGGFQFSLAEVATGTAVPENLTATASDSAVILDWDDDASGFPFSYYTVYRGTSSGTNNYDYTMNLSNLVSSALVDSGLTNGTTYYYAVTSTGTNGVESAFSDEVSATPQPAATNIVLIQHLDATVGASVTVTNGNEVLEWADQSGNGNHAVEGEGDPVLWPSTSLSGTGLSGMDVRTNRATLAAFSAADTDAFLDFTGEAVFNSGFSVLVAFKADYVTTNNTRNVVLGTAENMGGGANGFGLRYDRGNMYAFANSSGILTTINKTSLGGVQVVDGDTMVFAFTYRSSDGLMSFWDSKNDTVATATTAAYGDFSNNSFDLAGSGNGGQYMDGMIGEVQVFSSTLSESELISKGLALSTKWGAIAASGFDVWALDWGVDIGSTTNDYDLDGADNLYEYALNGNPTNAADKGQYAVVADGSFFKYIYASNSTDSALGYRFVDTTDLVFGTSPGTNSYASADAGPTAGDYTTVTNNYNTATDTLFIELEVEQN